MLSVVFEIWFINRGKEVKESSSLVSALGFYEFLCGLECEKSLLRHSKRYF